MRQAERGIKIEFELHHSYRPYLYLISTLRLGDHQ